MKVIITEEEVLFYKTGIKLVDGSFEIDASFFLKFNNKFSLIMLEKYGIKSGTAYFDVNTNTYSVEIPDLPLSIK